MLVRCINNSIKVTNKSSKREKGKRGNIGVLMKSSEREKEREEQGLAQKNHKEEVAEISSGSPL